jgi:hypothetical protein
VYLSYSGYKTYSECARAYYYNYIAKPKVAPDNRVNMLFGSVVGTIFERFYTDKAWKSKTVLDDLLGIVESTLQTTISQEMKRGGLIQWKAQDPKAGYHSKEDLLGDIKLAVPRGLEIIRQHRLLGVSAEAEVKLDESVKGHLLAGRADFIMERIAPHKDLIILDGKGSKHRERYVDHRQLFWYANLYRRRFGRLPDRLGFVFWRFAPDNAVDWVDVKAEEIEKLEDEVLQSMSLIEEKKRASTEAVKAAFPAFPSNKACEFCSYKPICEEANAFFTAKAAEKKSRRGLSAGVATNDLDGIGIDEG